MLPGIETQAEGGFGSSTGIRGEKPLAVPRSQLILEHTLVQHTRSPQTGAAAWNEIVDQRSLDKVLIVIRAHLFLADGHAELPKAQLELVDAMNVYVEIAQRGDGIREISFDSEVEVAVKLTLQSDSGPAKKEAVRRMIPRLITAEVE